MQQKIVPNLWCNGTAQECVDFYVSIFPESNIISTEYYPTTAEGGLADFQKNMAGQVLTIEYSLAGYECVAINAGSEFQLNPSISFMLNFDPSRDTNAEMQLNELWQKLSVGGREHMPLDSYPFSQRYGWIEDKFGVNWQLILTNPEGEPRPFIIPSLMFSQQQTNKAKEAIDYYTTVFQNAKLGTVAQYIQATGPAKAGAVQFADFTLAGQWFAAMDTAVEQNFTFNEALSFAVMCKDQSEIDYFWDKLSNVPEAEQCGWCKDKYGVSWQITPENVNDLLRKPGAFANMMRMKKLVIADF